MKSVFTLEDIDDFVSKLPDDDKDDWFISSRGAAQNIMNKFKEYLKNRKEMGLDKLKNLQELYRLKEQAEEEIGKIVDRFEEETGTAYQVREIKITETCGDCCTGKTYKKAKILFDLR